MNKDHLPAIQTQPMYPWVDLTPGNERMLSVMLANREVVEEWHAGLSFQTAHINRINPLVERIMRELYDQDWERVHEASFHGSMVFEVAAGLVGSEAAVASHDAFGRVEGIVMDYNAEELREYRRKATTSLIEDGLYTKEVVSHSAELLYPELVHYALVGAAISRQLTLDVFIHVYTSELEK